jgi:hypothetical protein
MDLLLPHDVRLEMDDLGVLDDRAVRTLDVKLKIAWQTLQDETHPGCGQPIWLSMAPDNWIEFDVESQMCYACEATDKRREQANKAKENMDGKTFYPVFGMVKITGPDGVKRDIGPRPSREKGLRKMLGLPDPVPAGEDEP